jgi:peptide-methionine (R)-S-oxide reductase
VHLTQVLRRAGFSKARNGHRQQSQGQGREIGRRVEKQLTPEQYRVTRQHGTERAFSNPLNNENALAHLHACCGTPLFSSETNSIPAPAGRAFRHPSTGTGRIRRSLVVHASDRSPLRVMRRDLGHVFPDGPKPSGARYCTNGVAIKFAPREPAKA